MKHIKMKYGFTLIELLVVVIIIAVLSAVAMPMYKHAVLKSRFSKVMPVAKSIVEAQEVYYLGKNIYAANDEKDLLDVSPSGDTTIELASRDQEDKYNYVAASSPEVPGARYIMYQKHSPRFAGQIHCEAQAAADEENEAVWLCQKGLKGTEILGGGSVNTAEGNYRTFLLEGTLAEGDNFSAGDSDEQDDDNGCIGAQPPDLAYTHPRNSAYHTSGTAQCVDGVWKYEWDSDSYYANNQTECTYGTAPGFCGGAHNHNTSCYVRAEYGCTGVTFTMPDNQTNYNSCSLFPGYSNSYGCAYSTFIGSNSGSVVCKGELENFCYGSTFEHKSWCVGSVDGGCNGTIITNAAYCEEKVAGGCRGAIIKDGGYCEPTQSGAGCTGAIYQAGGYCKGRSVGGYVCPEGTPANADWTQCWDGAGKKVACS